MVLRLVRREILADAMNPPFDDMTGLADHWWYSRELTGEATVWFAVTDESGGEVARVELEPISAVGRSYAVEAPAEGFAEIEFFEVREDLRGMGHGTKAVELLMAAYAGRTFAALSEDADQFRASMGWAKYLHQEEPRLNRALFVSA